MFSALYGRVVTLRNALYDRGTFKSHALGARTISIGNITTGGTGKTPLVAYIAGVLAERGEKVCILTRGYGRKNPKERVLVSDGSRVLVEASVGGDEPVELARKLLGKAVVIADPDRLAAGRWAKEKFGITAFVLDDGFQHRRLKRDIDIVCLDASEPFGNGRLLPFGRLRETVSSLSRAHVAVIMQTGKSVLNSPLRDDIKRLSPDAFVVGATRRMKSIEHVADRSAAIGSERFLAFAGLGNPAAFSAWLAEQDISVVGLHKLRDHHRYTQSDIDDLHAAAREKGANALLTTAKDAVKISNLKFEIPCFVIEIELVLDDPEGFAALL
jgi:tetraacyldisaccharide 4'-kinase